MIMEYKLDSINCILKNINSLYQKMSNLSITNIIKIQKRVVQISNAIDLLYNRYINISDIK